MALCGQVDRGVKRKIFFAVLISIMLSSKSYSEEVILQTKENVKLWSESFGDKRNPALLLIMGAMNQSIFWPREFCEELAKSGYYVIRYDHRDTGKSDGIDYQKNPYDLTMMKNDAVSVLNAHHIKETMVVGLSMGGYIAQLLAVENPERVSKLVLISTSADHRPYMKATMKVPVKNSSLPPPSENFLGYIKKSIESPPATKDEITLNIINGWRVTYAGSKAFPAAEVSSAIRLSEERSRSDVMPMNHALAANSSQDRLELVKQINMPTLVIHGKHDPCLPLEHGKYLSDNIPNSFFVVLDMGHSFQWSWDSEIANEIVAFDKLSGSA